MNHSFKVNPINVQGVNTGEKVLIGIPDECPICHNKIAPKRIIALTSFSTGRIDVIYQCTNHNCENTFISNFREDKANKRYIYNSSAPTKFIAEEFSEEIQKISEGFFKIYNQAIAAEANELDEIAGIGLRKSLEFLVKDYLIYKNPDKEEDIKKMLLGKCIKEYIEDGNIKTCVKRASWIGNDETHYIRKWEDKDIKDLKLLIKLSVNWIENSLLTEKYISEMPD